MKYCGSGTTGKLAKEYRMEWCIGKEEESVQKEMKVVRFLYQEEKIIFEPCGQHNIYCRNEREAINHHKAS